MNDILKEVLENGFHIKNEASLVSLQKMASISGMDLPDLSKEIGSRITKDQDSDTVYLYNE
jgi:predicted HTH domain antitoxin